MSGAKIRQRKSIFLETGFRALRRSLTRFDHLVVSAAFSDRRASRRPPRAEPERKPAWEISKRYTVDEIAAILCANKVPILSIHANRDVGAYVCSDEQADINYGKQLVQESLALTQKTDYLVHDIEKERTGSLASSIIDFSQVDYPAILKDKKTKIPLLKVVRAGAFDKEKLEKYYYEAQNNENYT